MKPFKPTKYNRLCLRQLLLGIVLMTSSWVHAVPSFARQTGVSCTACHSEFPILTEYGRQFKLSGYTMGDQGTLPPFAFMLQPSFTTTDKDQPGGAGPHFGKNNNFALTQGSLFYSGKLFGPYAKDLFGTDAAAYLNKIGTFSQLTFDGVARQLHWDNVEVRYADTGIWGNCPVTYGVYVNNNPGMQDPWNSTPVWGFPFSSSGLGPTPAAGTLIEGGLAQEVVGLGSYVMLSNSIYLDLGAYHTLDKQMQRAVGIDPSGESQVPGVAPYWRMAYTKSEENNSWETGLFGLFADTYPGRDNSRGEDHLVDIGIDSQYQLALDNQDLTGMISGIYESEQWDASRQLGNTSNRCDHLWSTKATVDYLYDKTYGGAVSYFFVDGSQDPLLYSGSSTGSPLSDGVVLQLNYLPLNKSGGPSFWPKSNVKFSVQYVIYNRFDGTSRHASDNNTLYLEIWTAF